MNMITQSGAEISATGGDFGLSFMDGEITQVIDAVVIDEPLSIPAKPAGRLRRALRRVALAALRAIQRLRGAATRAMQVGVYTRGPRRPLRYKARHRHPGHRAQRHWYGRQRSTSEYNTRRAVASRASAREGDLPRHPPEFISWLENVIETMRYEQLTLHPARHSERFVCS